MGGGRAFCACQGAGASHGPGCAPGFQPDLQRKAATIAVAPRAAGGSQITGGVTGQRREPGGAARWAALYGWQGRSRSGQAMSAVS